MKSYDDEGTEESCRGGKGGGGGCRVMVSMLPVIWREGNEEEGERHKVWNSCAFRFSAQLQVRTTAIVP